MNDSKNKLITIGITAYKEGEYLQKAWDSVANQTDNRWEAVMVLDGDADKNTTKIFDFILHPFLTKIKLDSNHGNYYTRTLAIENSKTDWYCQLDADDYLDSSFTKVIIDAINNHPDAEIFFGDIVYLNGDNTNRVSFKDTDIKQVPYLINGHVPIKKTIFSELGGFEKKLYYGAADRDFLFKCGLYNKNYRYIPDNILYYVRKREISTANKRRENIVQREQIFFHLNNNYKQYLIEIKCYDMFIAKTLKPIFYYYYYQRKYLQLFSLLFRFGYRAEYFLWKYFGKLILNRVL